MSSARPVSSLTPCDHSDTSLQPRSESHATKAARILAWASDRSRPSHAGTLAHPWWLWPNLLSLDAPLIAVLWLHLFAAAERIRIPPLVTVALALVVWLIYVADRLLDGLQTDPLAAMSARHEFYYVHRAPFSFLLLGVLTLTCWVCLELDSRTLELGALLILVVAGYFAAVHRLRTKPALRFSKEIVVAVVFGIGTVFPVSINAHRLSSSLIIDLALFIAICWINLVLIEYAEWVGLRDRRSGAPHPSTISGGRHLTAIGAAVAVVALCAARLSVPGPEQWVSRVIALSAVALAGLSLYRRNLSLHAVRVLADATLLTPAIVLLFLHN